MSMRDIRVEKVTVNIGVGESGERLEKARSLLEKIVNRRCVYTKAKKREQSFGIKKGQEIGVKVTLRGKEGIEFLERALEAVDRKIRKTSFDKHGNFSFGVREYIDLPGTKYDPTIGLMGFDVCVTLARPGYRVVKRKRARSKLSKRHRISREEAIEFVKNRFKVDVYD